MQYRLIILNSSGHAASVEDWSCASDGEAMDLAARRGSAFGCELWRGDHRLSIFAAALPGPGAGEAADRRA